MIKNVNIKYSVLIWMILFWVPASLLGQEIRLKGKTIHFCGDAAEWPPYHFWERKNGKKTKKVVGYDVDILQEIFEKHRIQVTFKLLPWKRCLNQVIRNKYQAALSASYSPERHKLYLMSEAYYTVTPKYFYATAQYPQGPPLVKTVSDLFRYKVCGLLGYNYAGFADGILSENIDRGTKNFNQLVSKTLTGRCDVFLARYEILAGFAKIEENYLKDGKIQGKPIPKGRLDPFYLLISKKYKYAYELKGIIDEGFSDLRRSGRMNIILKRYVK